MIYDVQSIYFKSEDYEIPFPHPGVCFLEVEACKFLCALIHHCKFRRILFCSGFSSSIMAYDWKNTMWER